MKIAVASGKGGTGKTTLSVNLSALLAEREDVVLSDVDVEEPNSGLFVDADQILAEEKFKMIPQWKEDRCTLCGLCQEVCNFHAVIQFGKTIMVFPELCHACHACSELCPSGALPMVPKKMGKLTYRKKGSLHFIESRLDIGEEQAVPLIRQNNGYVDASFPPAMNRIYDAPPGTSCPVIEVTKDADFVILVTEPTPFGLHDLTLAVETMRKLKRDFGVVINRHGIGDDKVEQYCEDESIKILAKLPNQRRIAELYAEGKLIYPEVGEFRQQLEGILDFLNTLKTHSGV